MLNSKGPRMDPCGISNKIFYQGVYDKFALFFFFLSVK